MQFGHEQLDAYRVSIRYGAWVYETAKRLRGMHRHARDRRLRAAQSIPLNIADRNGKLRCKNKLDSLSAWVSLAS